jgi:hypothetical protein
MRLVLIAGAAILWLTMENTSNASAPLQSIAIGVAAGLVVWILVFGFLTLHGDEVGVSNRTALPAALLAAVIAGIVRFVVVKLRRHQASS